MALPEYTRLGDAVTISTPASSVALAALTGYLLPPLFLLLGALGAASCYAGDLAAVLGAGLGLFAGVLLEGGIVEERVEGERFTSPSVQVDLRPDGSVEVLATHEQDLGGEDG